MRERAYLVAMLLALSVAACSSSEQPEVIEQIVVREPGEPLPAPAVRSSGDGILDLVARGEEAFQMCNGCHNVEAGAPSGAGPNLHGVVGRVAGSLEDYPYSEALASSQVTWNDTSLDLYLADPDGFIPGSDMLAGAVADEVERAAIIAYLGAAGSSASE